jgi:transcriptional antiterminator RfaH
VVLNLERDRWRSVNSTTGIATLFMAYDRPIPVPDGIVETWSSQPIRRECFSSPIVSSAVERCAGSPGPLHTRWEFLIRLNDAGRVEVLLEIMGAGLA